MPPPVSTPSDTGADAAALTRLHSLTSLRFFAALAVFAVHAVGQLWPGNTFLWRISGQGVTAVEFFFILSGFVLTWSYRTGQPVSAFYRRRAARILPLYYVTLLVALLVHVRGGAALVKDALPSFGLVQAWFPQATVHYGGNGPGWSLACEAVFYAVLPFLIAPLSRRSNAFLWYAIVVSVLASCAAALVLHPSADTGWRYWVLYLLPPVRLVEFVAGVCLGLVMRRGWRSPVPLRWVLAGTACVYVAAGWAPMALLPAALMFLPYLATIATAATADVTGARSPLRRPTLVRLGDWSFAFYLVQQTVMFVVVSGATHLPGVFAARVSLTVVAFVTCVAGAGVLHVLVERPLERRLRPGRGAVAIPAQPVPHPASAAELTLPISPPVSG
jgi:peptidoglycan/LPS O-acetylase OafA/YrhL